jgi:HAD superfamily phosphoserine phosphatase-like hydrolase
MDRKKVVCFDLDGTLLDTKTGIWDIMSQELIHDKEPSIIRLMRKWLPQRTTIGSYIDTQVTKAQMVSIIKGLRPVSNAVLLLRQLRKEGFVLALVSDSVDLVPEIHFPSDAFDYLYVNRLIFDDSGVIQGHIPYSKWGKPGAMRELAAHLKISPEQMVFVGDNINDIPALKYAGIGIAFNPKSRKVRRAADVVLYGDAMVLLSHIREYCRQERSHRQAQQDT